MESDRRILAAINTPVSTLIIGITDGKVALCVTPDIYQKRPGDVFVDDYNSRNIPLLQEAVKQMEEYFQHKRETFDLPLQIEGTDFRKIVWEATKCIPYGSTAAYSDIAKRIGKPKSCRAVGSALGANRFFIIIPCHRVVGLSSIGGYAGGLIMKRRLGSFAV